MRVAAVSTRGLSFGNKYSILDYISFSSGTTFLDYDILLWNPSGLLDEYFEYRGHPLIDSSEKLVATEETLNKISLDIQRRDKELKHMLTLGRFLFIFLPPPLVVDVMGRNHRIDLLPCYLESIRFDTVERRGSNIDFRGDEPFLTYWEKLKDLFEYKASFRSVPGMPLFFIKGTEVVIGSYQQVEKGHIIFIPALTLQRARDKKFDSLTKIYEASCELAEKLKAPSSSAKFVLPKWSNNYVLIGEQEQRDEISKVEEELQLILKDLHEKKTLLEGLEKKKALFAGIGHSLEAQVKEVFELLGFTTLEARPNRDDLILKYDSKIAVVEIKGVSKKSAAEKHAAQLEKWVSEFYYEHEIKPKGILVVNAYCDLPLKDRKDAFPPQMIPFSRAREHCLITGLQLLCLYLDCKGDSEKKIKMIELIFSTNGIFNEYQDWTKYIAMESDH